MAKKRSSKRTISPIDSFTNQITTWVGSTPSLIVHTLFFVACFALVMFGVALDTVLLMLTTVVSLEAIYLAIFIQRSVNQQATVIATEFDELEEAISEDIDETEIALKKDLDETEKNISDDIDETEAEITKDLDETPDQVEEQMEKPLDELMEEIRKVIREEIRQAIKK